MTREADEARLDDLRLALMSAALSGNNEERDRLSVAVDRAESEFRKRWAR